MSVVQRDDDDLFSTSNLFSFFSPSTPHAALDLPDPSQIRMQFPELGSTDIELPDVPDLQLDADLMADQDYQTSSGSSLSVSASLSPPSSLTLSPWPSVRTVDTCVNQCTARRSGSDTCLTAALRILAGLRVADTACLSAHKEASGAGKARGMETVLAMNRDAIAGIGPILACSSCSARSQVQLLLLSICGNLISWNGAVISAMLDEGDYFFSSACTPSSSAGSARQSPGAARVLLQPLTIGQHQINGKLGQVLRNQVIAGEIRTLEGLVDALSRHFNTTARDHSPSLNQGGGLSSDVHRHIISSLRTRLESTRAKIFT